jgi:hypothetical protein
MSYSRRDEAVMRRIAAFLRERGITVWVDNEKLVPGTPIWEVEIEKAIKSASAVIVILSPDSKSSEWVRREISFADQYHTRIFPVLVRGDEESSITLRLITRQYVDIRQNQDVGLSSMSTELSRYLKELDAQEQKAREEAKRLAREKAAKEKAIKEKAEREETEKITREKAVLEKAERDAVEKNERESMPIKIQNEEKQKAAKNRVTIFTVVFVVFGLISWTIINNVNPSISVENSTRTAETAYAKENFLATATEKVFINNNAAPSKPETFMDTFDDNSMGWALWQTDDSSETGSTYIANGVLKFDIVEIKRNQVNSLVFPGETSTNYELSVDGKIYGSNNNFSYGLFFRNSQSQPYRDYWFLVNDTQQYTVIYSDGSAPSIEQAIDWTYNAEIKPNDWNSLRVVVSDNNFDFYINGIKIASLSDSHHLSGRGVGLLISLDGNMPGQVWFDNFYLANN